MSWFAAWLTVEERTVKYKGVYFKEKYKLQFSDCPFPKIILVKFQSTLSIFVVM